MYLHLEYSTSITFSTLQKNQYETKDYTVLQYAYIVSILQQFCEQYFG